MFDFFQTALATEPQNRATPLWVTRLWRRYFPCITATICFSPAMVQATTEQAAQFAVINDRASVNLSKCSMKTYESIGYSELGAADLASKGNSAAQLCAFSAASQHASELDALRLTLCPAASRAVNAYSMWEVKNAMNGVTWNFKESRGEFRQRSDEYFQRRLEISRPALSAISGCPAKP